MRAFVVTPRFNSPLKPGPDGKPRTKRDADEFRRESERFVDAHDAVAQRYEIPNLAPFGSRLADLLAAVKGTEAPLGVVAMFCHGWQTGLQCGASLSNVGALGAALREKSAEMIILYACSAGRDADAQHDDDLASGPGGDGGFADQLRDASGVTVYAHATDGHTTRNPYVRVFRAGERGGGEWVIDPASSEWRAWRRALREDPTLRFGFPFWNALDLECMIVNGWPK